MYIPFNMTAKYKPVWPHQRNRLKNGKYSNIRGEYGCAGLVRGGMSVPCKAFFKMNFKSNFD